jgi:hypothetical protein
MASLIRRHRNRPIGDGARPPTLTHQPSAARPASVIRTRVTSIVFSPALTRCGVTVASPFLMRRLIVGTLKVTINAAKLAPSGPASASIAKARRWITVSGGRLAI